MLPWIQWVALWASFIFTVKNIGTPGFFSNSEPCIWKNCSIKMSFVVHIQHVLLFLDIVIGFQAGSSPWTQLWQFTGACNLIIIHSNCLKGARHLFWCSVSQHVPNWARRKETTAEESEKVTEKARKLFSQMWSSWDESSLRVGKVLLPQVKEFRYLMVLFLSSSNVDVKERAEWEGKGLNLTASLCSSPHLCSWALGSDQKKVITTTNS